MITAEKGVIMESITLATIAVFLSPYLVKAGEKISEETVKTLFESRQDLADKFKGLFRDEIISLSLHEAPSLEETIKLLEAKREIQETIRKKVEANQDLLNDLVSVLSVKISGVSINAEKIAQININSTVSQNITNF
jgi:hypothetical protein